MIKKLERDFHGYINNRGKSKYWGVTTGENSRGKDFWTVSFQDLNCPFKSTTTLRASWAEYPKEEDMARIAAMVYEQNCKDYFDKAVLSSDGKWVYWVTPTSTSIYREAYTAQNLYEFVPQLTLMDVEDISNANNNNVVFTGASDNVNFTIPEGSVGYGRIETSGMVFAEILDVIMESDLTQSQYKALIAIIETRID